MDFKFSQIFLTSKNQTKDDSGQEPVVKQWDVKKGGEYSIPYDISFKNEKHIAAVKAALNLIQEETCLNFRVRKKGRAWQRISIFRNVKQK